MSSLFLFIYRSLEVKYYFKTWWKDSSGCEIFANFSKTTKNRKKWDTVLNILLIRIYPIEKINRKINSIRTLSSRNEDFLSKMTLILPLKFEYANFNCNYILYHSCSWRVLVLNVLLKIMGGSYIFRCSSRISFNLTYHLNSRKLQNADEVFRFAPNGF